jgi:hypothetical protein
MFLADQLHVLLSLVELQAGQIDAVHASANFVAALSVLCSSVTGIQCSHEALEIHHDKLVSPPSPCVKSFDCPSLEDAAVNRGISDAALEACVSLLNEGSLEEVGTWRVRQSDFREPCLEVNGGAASAAESDAEVLPSAGGGSESECRKARPRNSFILVPAVSVSQLTRRNSEPTVKYAKLMDTPPLLPRRRRASLSMPSLLDSSEDTEDTEPLLFGAIMPAQRPLPFGHKGWAEAQLVVA